MECKLSKRHELIADYLTHELAEDESKAFEEHYLQCDACFQELRVAEDAMNLVEAQGPAVLGASKTRWSKALKGIGQRFTFPHFQKRWAFLTATAGAVATILIIFISLNHRKGQLHLSGPNFEPEPYLEEWVTESTRSGGEKIDAVLSPGIGEKFDGKEITFHWKMNEKIPVSLKILSNHEQEIFTAKPDPAQFPLLTVRINTRILSGPGLYYWRLEDETNVLFVGKFYFLGNN